MSKLGEGKTVGTASAALILNGRGPGTPLSLEKLTLQRQQQLAKERQAGDSSLLGHLRGKVYAGMIAGLAVNSAGDRI